MVCLTTPNKPGALARALEILSVEGISIEYMYAFSIGEEAFIIMKTEDINRTIQVLKENDMHLVKAAELNNK